MGSTVIAFAIAVPAAFTAGVIVHKYVISEVTAIKQHVSTAVTAAVVASEQRIRADVAATAAAIGKLTSKA